MIVICKTCKSPKDISEYYNSKNKSGHESSCKKCSDIRHYERRRARRIERNLLVKFPTLATRQLVSEGMKYCPGCKQVIPISEFSTMKVKSGIASHCRDCSNRYARERNSTEKSKIKRRQKYRIHRDRQINNKLSRSFGITYDEYKKILESQNNVCLICGKTPEQNGKMLAVDHNHSTSKNRGLLCSSCNICIGFIEKNNLDLKRIMWYLEHHS